MMDGVQTMIYTVHSVHIYIYIFACCYVIRSLVEIFNQSLCKMLKNDENFLTLCSHSVKFLANLEWFHTRIDV